MGRRPRALQELAGLGEQAAGHPVGDDPRHGVAATVVVAEDLREEAPDGPDGAEHPVAVLDAMFVEGVVDAGLGQDVGERQSLVAREPVAELIQADYEIGLGESGRNDRDEFGAVELLSVHTYSTTVPAPRFMACSRRRASEPRGVGSVHGGPMVAPARPSGADRRIVKVRIE